jgi:hypothetical protein
VKPPDDFVVTPLQHIDGRKYRRGLLSLATAVCGLFVYYGRGLLPGLTLAIAWMAIGLASTTGVLVIALVVVYCISPAIVGWLSSRARPKWCRRGDRRAH